MSGKKPNKRMVRKGVFWLRFFGVLEVLTGLMFVAAAFGCFSAMPEPGPFVGTTPMARIGYMIAGAFSVLVAVPNLVVGIGSLLIKRWARTMALVLAWGLLLQFGLGFVLGLLVNFLPAMVDFSGFSVALSLVTAGISSFVTILFSIPVLLPPVFVVLVYSSRSARAALDARNPGTRSMPIPLAFGVLLFALGVCGVCGLAAARMPVPLFGIILTDAALFGYLLFLTCAYVYFGWGFYHRQRLAWTCAMSLLSLMIFSSIVTLFILPPDEFMALALGETSRYLASNEMAGYFKIGEVIGIGVGIFELAFFLFLKRYFSRPKKKARIRIKDFDTATVSG